jgi:hypothetical protein
MKSLNQNSGLGSLDSFPSVVVVLFFHRSKGFSELVLSSGLCCC